jgi:alpha-galactosidase
VALGGRPVRFYRHGWQSWSLAAWLDAQKPLTAIRDKGARAKDEDPVYAEAQPDVGASVGAADLGGGETILLGALGPGGRVKLEGTSLAGWYEQEVGDWLIARGSEERVFSEYCSLLSARLGSRGVGPAPGVWCSWYSLNRWVSERNILGALQSLETMPFDVFQIDDGWQTALGNWEPNRKFPSGMAKVASRIRETGRRPGLWLAPLLARRDSQLVREHPEWVLRDGDGQAVPVGFTWAGSPLALDCSHPAVLDWLTELIHKVRSWGYDYMKLDFLYAGALPGHRFQPVGREAAYRGAMGRIRQAAGDTYIVACGAPIIPSLGLVDGLRIGPDVAPYWVNPALSQWLNNPSDPGVQNAIRTSLHRLWLKPLVHLDIDATYFRSRNTSLTPEQRQLHADLGVLADSKGTSDLWHVLSEQEGAQLRDHLAAKPNVQRTGSLEYRIDGRIVDFTDAVRLSAPPSRIPAWLAKALGFAKVGFRQVLPAMWESRRGA